MGAHTGKYVTQCALYSAHSHAPVCPCVWGSSERRTMENPTPQMEAIGMALAQTLMSMLPALLTQPAQTVTQAVTTVAKKGKRKIAPAIRAKVKALRAQNGGPLHSHDPTWKLIDDGIVTEQGDLIADAMAPTAGPAYVEANMQPTEKQLMRMTKKELVAMLQG